MNSICDSINIILTKSSNLLQLLLTSELVINDDNPPAIGKLLDIIQHITDVSIKANQIHSITSKREQETIKCIESLSLISRKQQEEIRRLKLKPQLESVSTDTGELVNFEMEKNKREKRELEIEVIHLQECLDKSAEVIKRYKKECIHLKRDLHTTKAVLLAQEALLENNDFMQSKREDSLPKITGISMPNEIEQTKKKIPDRYSNQTNDLEKINSNSKLSPISPPVINNNFDIELDKTNNSLEQYDSYLSSDEDKSVKETSEILEISNVFLNSAPEESFELIQGYYDPSFVNSINEQNG